MLTQHRMTLDEDLATTRERIVATAGDLFVAKTYAGTSMSLIAEKIGTTKAAIYHHFPSKDAILVAVLSDNIAAMAKLSDLARQTQPRPEVEEIFDGLVSMFVGSPLGSMLVTDPSVYAAYGRYYDRNEFVKVLVAAIAGPNPSEICAIRARGAIAAVREATLTTMAAHSTVRPEMRNEIVAMGMRIIGKA